MAENSAMQLFLADIDGGVARLREEEVRHAVRVLRKQPGDEISVINGQGSLFKCRIDMVTKSQVRAVVLEEKAEFGAVPYDLHMAIAPTKNIDRFEWFLEKATEHGISSVYPILTHITQSVK